MLKIIIPEMEGWDEEKQEFVFHKEQHLTLEHSLVSLSKWESKWQKPFLTQEQKTIEETRDYIKCMTLTQNVNPEIYNFLSNANIIEVNNYISNKMSATTFSDKQDKPGKMNGEQITSELIYYWMVALQIPFECQKWHLNRLLTLIKICNIKNEPSKKMGKVNTMKQNASLNAARRAKMHSRG